MSRKNKKPTTNQSDQDSYGPTQPWLPSDEPISPLRQSPVRLPGWAAVLILIVVTGALNLVGINWGLPNYTPWNSDSIAGTKTIRMIPRLFKSWRVADNNGNLLTDRHGRPVIERYPRAQFLITGSIYKLFIKQWKEKPFTYRDPRTGRVFSQWHSLGRVSALILVSRIVTVLMAIGAVLGVFATTRLVCRDSLAGFLAAMVLMFSAEFTYFSHLGNLDTPVTFWFIWTAYWLVRALQSGRYRYFILAGIFAGLVVCTKDPSFGHLAGPGIFVAGAAIHHYYKKHPSLAGIARVFIEPRLWAAALCFGIVVVIMNNVITDYAAFITRVRHWTAVKLDYIGEPGHQWRLLLKAFKCIRDDCGLWMSGALSSSLLYCAWKHRIKLLWAVGPFIMFHLLITIGALQVQPRYHLPSLAFLAIMFGSAGSDLLKAKRIPAMVRTLPLAVLLVLAAMYAIAVDAEMVGGSRERAEKWIRENLNKRTESITFISPSIYMPRARNEGYRVNYTHNADMTTAASLKGSPKLIALADKWYLDSIHFDQDFRKKLLGEKLGYRKIAEFGPRFVPPGTPNAKKCVWGAPPAKGIFHIATYSTRPRRVLSPTIVFMERTE